MPRAPPAAGAAGAAAAGASAASPGRTQAASLSSQQQTSSPAHTPHGPATVAAATEAAAPLASGPKFTFALPAGLDLAHLHVVLTGGTSGIGLEAAKVWPGGRGWHYQQKAGRLGGRTPALGWAQQRGATSALPTPFPPHVARIPSLLWACSDTPRPVLCELQVLCAKKAHVYLLGDDLDKGRR